MAVLFLASDDARFITAQTLIVDGGEIGGGGWYDEADAPPPPPERPADHRLNALGSLTPRRGPAASPSLTASTSRVISKKPICAS